MEAGLKNGKIFNLGNIIIEIVDRNREKFGEKTLIAKAKGDFYYFLEERFH